MTGRGTLPPAGRSDFSRPGSPLASAGSGLQACFSRSTARCMDSRRPRSAATSACCWKGSPLSSNCGVDLRTPEEGRRTPARGADCGRGPVQQKPAPRPLHWPRWPRYSASGNRLILALATGYCRHQRLGSSSDGGINDKVVIRFISDVCWDSGSHYSRIGNRPSKSCYGSHGSNANGSSLRLRRDWGHLAGSRHRHHGGDGSCSNICSRPRHLSPRTLR